MFTASNELFLIEYASETKFIEYYTPEWYKSGNNTWYEVYSKNICSTNNALEATNRVIKDCVTSHRSMSVSMFLNSYSEFISVSWSKKKDENVPNPKPFKTVA
jgi:hypothetical protein